MHKTKIELNEDSILIGLTERTNNQNESNSGTVKIEPLVQRYFANQVAAAFKHRANPGVTYCAYTEYESDHNGDYTYFIGEAVRSLDDQNTAEFNSLIIPADTYIKFTTDSGNLPNIVINAWQDIWQMSAKELGGKRNYLTDFEVYDERASDPNNAVVDIYIGIEKQK